MRATRIMANLRVADVEATKSFYTDYLGLRGSPYGRFGLLPPVSCGRENADVQVSCLRGVRVSGKYLH
jgi:hypothetical protein